jgi:hypothetical protein
MAGNRGIAPTNRFGVDGAVEAGAITSSMQIVPAFRLTAEAVAERVERDFNKNCHPVSFPSIGARHGNQNR